MGGPLTFLVVDYVAESRFLLVKTLRRKFADATVLEADEADRALEILDEMPVSVVVTHRTFEIEGIVLVRLLRVTAPTVPIVMVSGIDRESAALAAGADRFLLYDEWLRIGTVVEEVLAARTAAQAKVASGTG